MSVRNVLRMGDPSLRQKAQPITEFNSPDLEALIRDMLDTMAACDGAGLAAPQIGVSKRVVIFGLKDNPRYPLAEPVPQTILINPEIQVLSEERSEDWEGCLSVPGMRGKVPRYQHIRYSGYDAAGNHFYRSAEGFHARVVQHECDHLDGILYPDRVEDFRFFGFIEELSLSGALPYSTETNKPNE